MGLLKVIKTFMDDNKDEAVKEDVQAVEDVSEAPADEPKVETPEEVEQPEEKPDQEPEPDEKEGDTSSEGRKPTRKERRIQQLIGKLKDKDKAESQGTKGLDQLLGLNPNEPLIKPEEYEQGVDPQELERRQRNREMALEQRVLNRVASQQQYREKVGDHLKDAEAMADTLASDPDLDKAATRLYNDVNYQVDPYTGKEVFTPRRKMSEIVENLQNVVSKRATAETTKIGKKIAEQISEEAVRPTGAKPKEASFGDKSLEDMERELGIIN